MLAMVMVIAAIVFGGNALTAPLAELTAEWLIAMCTMIWLWTARSAGLPRLAPRAWLIAAVVLALPLLQLVPLPAALWHRLPGRGLEIQALALIGRADSWRPLSLTPARTLAALLTAACGVAMLLVTASLDRRGRDRVLAAIVAGAGLTLLVGAAQLSGGDGSWFRFYQPHQDYLTGFQSSHDMAADILLIGLAAFGALIANRAETARPIAAGAESGRLRGIQPGAGKSGRRSIGPLALLLAGDMLLILGVELAGSRTGIALLFVPIAAQAAMFRHRLALTLRSALIGVAALLVAAGFLAAVLWNNSVLDRVFARFALRTELRPEIWHDGMVAVREYFPWGSGLGSFMPIFMPVERLEAVRIFHFGTADCDYLQLVIEAGLPGLLLVALVGTVLGGAALRQLRAHRPRVANQAVCAVSILSTIGIHSLLEFPLRTIALAGMAGIGGALLLPEPARPSPQEP